MEFLSLEEAAQALDVTRRRAQALVEKGQLRAHRIGGRWLVEATDVHHRRRMVAQRGRPLKASTAWNEIAVSKLPRTVDAQDRMRRRVLTRAEHRDAFVHPSLIDGIRNDTQYVLGGRDAADAAELPVGITDRVDVYVRSSDLDELTNAHVVRFEPATANLHLHIVSVDVWPFNVDQRFTPLLVAWLDLADREDRAERIVREHLLRSRS